MTKPKPHPLTGNRTAIELKKFFRKHKIRYYQSHSHIVTDSLRWPPLVFLLKDGYVTVYNKNSMDWKYSFPCTSINGLFIKLFQYRLVLQKHIFLKN